MFSTLVATFSRGRSLSKKYQSIVGGYSMKKTYWALSRRRSDGDSNCLDSSLTSSLLRSLGRTTFLRSLGRTTLLRSLGRTTLLRSFGRTTLLCSLGRGKFSRAFAFLYDSRAGGDSLLERVLGRREEG